MKLIVLAAVACSLQVQIMYLRLETRKREAMELVLAQKLADVAKTQQVGLEAQLEFNRSVVKWVKGNP